MSMKNRLGLSADPVFLIDGNAFIYRAFYAYPDLKRSDGAPSNALFIVLRLLFRLIREEKPAYVGFFLDGRGKATFRHELFEAYKAQRLSMPEPLAVQFEPIREAVGLLGLKLIVSEGGEADDCIASLAARFKSERPVIIMGADKDLNQCLDERVTIWDPGLKTEKVVTLKSFMDEFRMAPEHWPDFQALIGDSSDNIPGVPGVGPKTALKLLERFPTLEDLRDHFDELTPAEKKKLDGHMEQVFVYRKLTRLQTSQCDDLTLEDFRRQAVELPDLLRFLDGWEFRSLSREAPQVIAAAQPVSRDAGRDAGSADAVGSAASPAPGQASGRSGQMADQASGQASDRSSGLSPAQAAGAAAPESLPPAKAAKGAGRGKGKAKAEQFSLFGDQPGPSSGAAPGAEAERPEPPHAPLADLPAAKGLDVGLLPVPAPAAPSGRKTAAKAAAAASEEGQTSGEAGEGLDGSASDAAAEVAASTSPSGSSDASGPASATSPAAFYVGLDGREFTVPASPAELAAHLKDAALIGVDSYKNLLSADPAWEAVPLGAWFDLSLSAYLLDPEERNYSWERLRHVLAAEMADLSPPCEGFGLLALCLARGMEERLRQAGLLELMRTLEMPLIPVLTAMERRGVRIDQAAFAAFFGEVNGRIEELTRSIYDHAGGPFNLRSSQQLAEILFTRLDLAGTGKGKSKTRKTPGGAQSTAVAVLEKLKDKHPMVAEILEFRKLEKLRSTYLEPLPRLAGPDGRVRTTFNNLATATGRLSSSNPNLQNIPIRGEFGSRMRSCFTAEPGKLLAAADYSQIELRILAHASQDPELLAAFQGKEDIHRRTAALIFDKAPADVAPDERRGAKTINFGLLYGMGPQRLAGELGVSLTMAKDFIERYFAKLGRLREFYEGIVELAKEQGFVTTMFGRRRLLPNIRSRNENLAQIARRQAINTVIQGSAADIIKVAMLHAHADEELKRLNAELILQVHDELVMEVPEATARQAGQRLSDVMCGVIELDAPLAVDWGVGPNWGEAH